jgi:bacillithiol biosynthesis cysteine-adding enzyme BshC
MTSIPLERYPGLAALFLDFARGGSRFHPDPPTLDAAIERGKALLGRARRALPAEAFRFRSEVGRRAADDLARGRAVAVLAGHQIGLFTGPLYTLVKAFDAIVLARELTRRGLPAVPVFWALTDDHDLEEIAKTAKPGPDGAQSFVLEGADRSNRHPVGPLPIPGAVSRIVEAFREDTQGEEATEILDLVARRYAAGTSYGEAFIESLLDLTEDDDPLLVVDPLEESIAQAARQLFATGLERRAEIAETLRRTAAEIDESGRKPSVPFRSELFPFFVLEGGIRRRVETPELEEAGGRVARGELGASADVLTRPVLKSLVLPVAASVLGPSEIAYHAQSLPLFPIFDAPVPVLISRTFLVVRGAAERRAAQALGIADEDLLAPRAAAREAAVVPEADRVVEIARRLDAEMATLAPEVQALDPTLAGALETARRKATYQLEQLGERMRKAAERKDEVALSRRRRLETMLLPGGEPAERVYPPLVFLRIWGRSVLDAIRAAAGSGGRDVRIVDGDVAVDAQPRRSHAG